MNFFKFTSVIFFLLSCMPEESGYKLIGEKFSDVISSSGRSPNIDFRSGTSFLNERTEELKITIRTDEVLEKNLILEAEIEGSEAELNINSEDLVLKAGADTFDIRINFLDNDEIDGDKEFIIRFSNLELPSLSDKELKLVIIDDEFPDASAVCRDSLKILEETVKPKLQTCQGCHAGLNPSGDLAFDYEDSEELCINLRNSGILNFRSPRQSEILTKPLGEESHGGGIQLNPEDVYDIVNWIQKEAKPNEENLFSLSTIIPNNSGFSSAIEGTSVDYSGNLYAVGFSTNGVLPFARISPRDYIPRRFYGGVNGQEAGDFPNGSRVTVNNHFAFVKYRDGGFNGLAGSLNILDFNQNGNPLIRSVGVATNNANDIAVSPQGIYYVSDPNFGGGTGQVWMYDPNQQQAVRLRLNNSNSPFQIPAPSNGIDVDPSGEHLYVAAGGSIYRWDIQANGTVDPQTQSIFAIINDPANNQANCTSPDGMRFDRLPGPIIQGNLWVTCASGAFPRVMVVNPLGEIIRSINMSPFGQGAKNLAFGGPDGRTLYIVNNGGGGQGNIVQMRVDNPGAAWVEKEIKKLKAD